MYVYRILLFLVLGGYLLSPLMMSGWASPGVAWYRPFIIWFFADWRENEVLLGEGGIEKRR